MAGPSWLDQALFADLPWERRCSYLCFSLALLVALGSYQFVGPVKVSIFLDVVGAQLEPVAKSLVLLVLLPVLVLYSMLVSLLADPKKLVLCVCSVFGLLYVFISVELMMSAGHPPAWVAWLLYYTTETRAVFLMPMIWSVVTDVTTPELAKKVYPPMFFVVQLGGIAGSFFAVRVHSLGGEVGLLLIQAGCFAVVAGLSWVGCSFVGNAGELAPLVDRRAADLEASGQRGAAEAAVVKKGPSGPGGPGLQRLYEGLEGLWLLLSRPYVFMSFWVSYATLMPRTVLDYQNSVLAQAAFGGREHQISYFGRVNLMSNTGTALLTLLGTRPIVAWLGMGRSLLVLPCVVFCCILALCAHYGLWTSTWAVVVASTVAYGLNSPCKEMLYVRTSREIKYKAKSWSEMYGNQLMKLLGAQINLWVNLESASCKPHCFHAGPTAGIVGLWVALWACVALQLGRQHERLEAEDGRVS